MGSDSEDNERENGKASVIQEVVPVGTDHVTLAENGRIEETLLFLGFLLNMLVK